MYCFTLVVFPGKAVPLALMEKSFCILEYACTQSPQTSIQNVEKPHQLANKFELVRPINL